MYTIELRSPNLTRPIIMPKDRNLSLEEALYRKQIYKRSNKEAEFKILSEDVVYERENFG